MPVALVALALAAATPATEVELDVAVAVEDCTCAPSTPTTTVAESRATELTVSAMVQNGLVNEPYSSFFCLPTFLVRTRIPSNANYFLFRLCVLPPLRLCSYALLRLGACLPIHFAYFAPSSYFRICTFAHLSKVLLSCLFNNFSMTEPRSGVLNFQGSRYPLDQLPEPSRQAVNMLQDTDQQIRFHEQALRVAYATRKYLVEDLKASLTAVPKLPD